MILEVIGANTAFSEGVNTSLLLWKDQEKTDGVLLDCGYSVLPELRKKGYLERINTVLLTHLHQDHCGSAITLLQYRSFFYQKPTIIGGADWDQLITLCGPVIKTEPLSNQTDLEKIPVFHAKGMECFALFVAGKVIYTGDCAESVLDLPQAKSAKIIFHDVSLTPSVAHADISTLAKAPADIRAKTWLTHYDPNQAEAFEAIVQKYGFAGLSKSGLEFAL